MTYLPHPIDTAYIKLPDELTALRERIAEHVHDLWAQTKLADGWTFGETTDKDAKKHSDLIPYAELSETMKAYDRNTAEGTLKLLLKLGFKIVCPTTDEGEIVCVSVREIDHLNQLSKAGYEVKAAYNSGVSTYLVMQRRTGKDGAS